MRAALGPGGERLSNATPCVRKMLTRIFPLDPRSGVVTVGTCIDRSGPNARNPHHPTTFVALESSGVAVAERNRRRIVAPDTRVRFTPVTPEHSSGGSDFHRGSSATERSAKASAMASEAAGLSPAPGTNASEAIRFGGRSNEPTEAGSTPAGRTKLYAVVRSDLSPGAKACQAAHALRSFAAAYPALEAAWWRDSNTLVLLETGDLERLEQRARDRDITCVRFVEPDWAPDGTLTALCLGQDARKLVSGLPLAFGNSSHPSI